MSDKITSSQIFLFLAKQANWKEEADTNKNDPLTKGEMREYLNSEAFKDFAGVKIQDVSAKTFNDFWAKLDSNVNNNKLDSTEFEKADETISKYEQLNNKISALKSSVSGNISPNKLGQWEGRLAELLMTKVDNNEITIDELLNNDNEINKAFNRATAEVLADQYKDSAAVKSLISNAGIDYDITKDETLTNIINQYIDKKLLAVGENDTVAQLAAADIDKEIKNLIANYLKEASLESETVKASPAVDLSPYGYDKNVLNDVQKAVLVKDISSKLSTEKSKFAGYEKEFDEVLNKFIENYIATNDVTATDSQSLFKTLSGKVNDIKSAFIASDDYKNLKNTVDVYSKYRDNMEESFTTAVKTALGDNADLFLNNCKTSKDYDAILQNIISRINNGDEALMTNGAVDWTKVQTAIIESVTTLINGASTASGELSGLQTDYENNSSDIEKAREKAIAYCDAAKAKGGEYAEAVEKVFGSNHKTTIEGIDDTIKLATKMKTLFGLIAKISAGQDINSEISSWTGAEQRTMIAGMTKSFQVTATLDASMDPSKVTYNAVSAQGGNITMTNTAKGKFNYTAPKEGGYDTITINSYYAGKLVGSTTITIEVAEVSGWINDPSGGHLEVFGTNGAVADDSQVSATDFATLYNNNAIINLARGNGTGNSSDGNGRLDNLIDMIKQSLRNGLDADKLNQACDIVAKRYKNNIINMGQVKDNKHGKDFSAKTAPRIQAANYSGICYQYDKEGRDSHVIMVSFKNLVDDILAEYSKL